MAVIVWAVTSATVLPALFMWALNGTRNAARKEG